MDVEEPNAKAISEPLKRWRISAGLSEEEAGKLLKVQPETISNYESVGASKVPLSHLIKFIQAYGIPPAEAATELSQTISPSIKK